MATPGGSSGSGGYGNAQNQANHQGQQAGSSGHDMHQSRGERFDEEQGGGRSYDSISGDNVAQVGGSEGSFDQITDSDALGAQADELLGGEPQGRDGGDFERDAES
jgi:hypothetical protein